MGSRGNKEAERSFDPATVTHRSAFTAHLRLTTKTDILSGPATGQVLQEPHAYDLVW